MTLQQRNQLGLWQRANRRIGRDRRFDARLLIRDQAPEQPGQVDGDVVHLRGREVDDPTHAMAIKQDVVVPDVTKARLQRDRMTQPMLDDKASRAQLEQAVPMPIGRDGRPEEIAELLLWLTSPENSLMVGQILFIDGGAEATVRGDTLW